MNSSQHQSLAIFTACNVAYLHKALVLAESLLAHGGPRLKIVLCDRRVELPVDPALAEVIWIEETNIPNLKELAFKYDITEFGTSIKPFMTLELLREADKVIYLDPDIALYAPLTPIIEELDRSPIILTPHYVTPQPNTMENPDVGMMRFGSFNLGFYAVRKSDEGIQFAQWLSDRCFDLCYFETQFGLSTDQKWVSIAPCFFPNLRVSFDLGYNVAFWNAHERRVSKDASGKYVVNDKFPLVFFHYSSFDEDKLENLSKRPFPDKGKRPDLLQLSVPYKARLDARRAEIPKTRYAFDYMSGGEYISPTLRRAYAAVMKELPPHDPFDSAGIVGDFARRNHLFEKRQVGYVPAGVAETASHGRAFAFIYFSMRMILRVLGPNRFANFSRLLVYLSSYRQNRPLWKL